MSKRLNTIPIPEYFEIGNRGLPINEIGRNIQVNSKGNPRYNSEGNPMYNGKIFFNSEGNPIYKKSSNQTQISPEPHVKYQGNIQTNNTPAQFIKHEMGKYTKQNNSQNSNKIKTNNKTGFKYLMQGEKRIKVNSSGQPEKYANGKNVTLGEQGYPINSKGKFLKFDVRTGDLVKNSSGNPYVYNPFLGGFKVPELEIKYRYPPSLRLDESRNTAKSFFNAQGPGSALEPARFGQKSQSPLGGFKVHKTPQTPQTPPENISHLYNTGTHEELGLLNRLRKFSIFSKNKEYQKLL